MVNAIPITTAGKFGAIDNERDIYLSERERIDQKRKEIAGIDSKIEKFQDIMEARLASTLQKDKDIRKSEEIGESNKRRRGRGYNEYISTNEVHREVEPSRDADIKYYKDFIDTLLEKKERLENQIDRAMPRLNELEYQAHSSEELFQDAKNAKNPAEFAAIAKKYKYGELSKYTKGKIRGELESSILTWFQDSEGGASKVKLDALDEAGVPDEFMGKIREFAVSNDYKNLVRNIEGSGEEKDFESNLGNWVKEMNGATGDNRKIISQQLKARINKEVREKSESKDVQKIIDQLKDVGLDSSFYSEIEKYRDKMDTKEKSTDVDVLLKNLSDELKRDSSPNDVRDKVRPILGIIEKVKDEKKKEALTNGLIQKIVDIYKDSGKNTEERKDFLGVLKMADLPKDLIDRVSKFHKEFETGEREDQLENLMTKVIPEFEFKRFPPSVDEFAKLNKMVSDADGDEKALKKIKGYIGYYYHDLLTTPSQRSKFVEMARTYGVDKEIIGEYLWKETQEKRIENQEIVDDYLPMIQEFVQAMPIDEAQKFFDEQLAPALIIESRAGLPREIIQELRHRFIEACANEFENGSQSQIMYDITKAYGDRILMSLLPEGLDPFSDDFFGSRGDRGPERIQVDVPNGLVVGNKIQYGMLRQGLRGEVYQRFGNVEPQRQDILFEEMYRNVVIDLTRDMEYVLEIRARRREVQEIKSQRRWLYMDRAKTWFDRLKLPISAIMGGLAFGVWQETLLFGKPLLSSIFEGTFKISDLNTLSGPLGFPISFIRGLLPGGLAFVEPTLLLIPLAFYLLGKVKEASIDNMEFRKYKEQLESAEIAYETSVADFAAKRGVTLSQKRSYFDLVSREVLTPVMSKGRKALESRYAGMRRTIAGMQAPSLDKLVLT